MIRWMIKICWSCSWITGGFFWDVFVIKFKTGKNIYPKKACFSPAMLWKKCTRFVAMEFILKCCVLLSLYGYYGKEHSFYSSPKFHFRMSCGWPFSQTVGTFKISNGFKFESCWLDFIGVRESLKNVAHRSRLTGWCYYVFSFNVRKKWKWIHSSNATARMHHPTKCGNTLPNWV